MTGYIVQTPTGSSWHMYTREIVKSEGDMKVKAQMKAEYTLSHLFIENFEIPICNNVFLLFEIGVLEYSRKRLSEQA